MVGKRHQCADARHGTTAVETAMVLPVFLFFVLSLVEFAHAQMIGNVLRSACRTAARIGSTEGQSTSSVEAQVRQVLGGAMDPQAVEVLVKDCATLDAGGALPADAAGYAAMPDFEVADAEPRALFLVRARIAYNDVALVPMPFMQGVMLQGQAFMRHE